LGATGSEPVSNREDEEIYFEEDLEADVSGEKILL
jgi:hypothetical protein